MSLRAYLTLPAEISDFERQYLGRMNRIAMVFFIAHIPILMAVAALCDTGPTKALFLSLLMLAGPLIARRTLENPRDISRVFAVTATGMGGLLVHFGQGPMQIEMHFYFFVLLALMVVFADPTVILIGALTVFAHHLTLYILVPSSVFNYEASIWAVVVHVLFVVLESVAACFVARSFFDSVVGLEKIVRGRTEELARRTRDVRTMLDNAGQGFSTFDGAGYVAPERSTILERWLGDCPPGARVWEWLANVDPNAAALFEMGWEAVTDDVLPLELTIAQMPQRMMAGEKTLELEYRPLLDDGKLQQVLLIITDISIRVESERYEAENREILVVFERVLKDRAGFLEFMREADELVGVLSIDTTPLSTARRALHTLKGNCGTFGLAAVADLCHRIEDKIVDREDVLELGDTLELVDRWHSLSTKISGLLGQVMRGKIEVTDGELESVLLQLVQGVPRREIIKTLEEWSLEPTEIRLARMAEQATMLAKRLGKEVRIEIASNGVRVARTDLGAFWSSLVHLIRNAVDHGLETPEERLAAGKSAIGCLAISTSFEGNEFVLRASDDGPGIDWERVRLRAANKGLPCASDRQLEEALFANGFSTRESTNEYSGRGVGLFAVRAICQELGGHVAVHSKLGVSTTIELRLPIHRVRIVSDARRVSDGRSVPRLSLRAVGEAV